MKRITIILTICAMFFCNMAAFADSDIIAYIDGAEITRDDIDEYGRIINTDKIDEARVLRVAKREAELIADKANGVRSTLDNTYEVEGLYKGSEFTFYQRITLDDESLYDYTGYTQSDLEERKNAIQSIITTEIEANEYSEEDLAERANSSTANIETKSYTEAEIEERKNQAQTATTSTITTSTRSGQSVQTSVMDSIGPNDPNIKKIYKAQSAYVTSRYTTDTFDQRQDSIYFSIEKAELFATSILENQLDVNSINSIRNLFTAVVSDDIDTIINTLDRINYNELALDILEFTQNDQEVRITFIESNEETIFMVESWDGERIDLNSEANEFIESVRIFD